LGKKRHHFTKQEKFLTGLAMLIPPFTLAFYALVASFPRSWLALPITGMIFSIAILMLYKVTIKKVKLNYPLTSPTGKPDVYTGNEIPRPIYEDEQRYPWFFNKKRLRKKLKKEQTVC
jgi:hypothetical protein